MDITNIQIKKTSVVKDFIIIFVFFISVTIASIYNICVHSYIYIYLQFCSLSHICNQITVFEYRLSSQTCLWEAFLC